MKSAGGGYKIIVIAEAMVMDERGAPLKFRRGLTEAEQTAFDKWVEQCLADSNVRINIRGKYPATRVLPKELRGLVKRGKI